MALGGLGKFRTGGLTSVRAPAVGESTLGSVRGFPFAQGWNVENITGPRALAAGSRRIYHVTTTDPSGQSSIGSVQAGDYVVFDISGTIFVDSLYESPDNVYWAFQTAPDPGITLSTSGNFACFGSGQNNIISHLRARGQNSTNADMVISAHSSLFVNCSVSWARGQDNFSVNAEDTNNVNAYRCNFSENVYIAGGNGGNNVFIPRGTILSMVECLMGNVHGARNPFIHHNANAGSQANKAIVASCLVYNHGPDGGGANAAQMRDHPDGTVPGDFVYEHNGWIGGPETRSGGLSVLLDNDGSTATARHQFYLGANAPGSSNFFDNPAVNGPPAGFSIETPTVDWEQLDTYPFTTPSTYDPYVPSDITDLRDYLVSVTGARPSNRDEYDAAILSDVTSGTGSLQSGSQPSMNTLAENTATWTEPASPFVQAEGEETGWTNVEKSLWQSHLDVGGTE